MKKNNLVLYKNKPALITDISADKFEITLSDTVKKVRAKDIILLHPGECTSLNAALHAELADVDFSEAADFFEGETPLFSDIAELLWGSSTPEQSWKIWQNLCESPYFVCTAPNIPIRIRTQAEIEQEQYKQSEKEAAQAVRTAFISALHRCVQGNTPMKNILQYSPFFQEIEAAALTASGNCKILKEAGLDTDAQSAHEVLLKTGFWSVEKNPYPARFSHSLHSSKTEIPAPIHDGNITDLRHIPAYAIDNADSTDPDDAVSFDGTYLWIHIANPADVIPRDSPADKDARERGSTLYIPEGAARMLGENAVTYFALGLTEESYALSFRILLDDAGSITDTAVMRTRLCVTRLTYTQADTQKDTATLAPLFAIAKRNYHRRHNAGAVSIEFPETVITLHNAPDGSKQVHIEPATATEAAAMIKEMMLLAGEAAARFAFKNGIPFQYISQEPPELPDTLPTGLAGEYRKRRVMRSRSVGTIPARHAALGIPMYGQVTSPLRRYGDLVSHRQLLAFIDNRPLNDASSLIIEIAAGDEASRLAVQAERATRRHWTLVYLLQHPEWSGTAIVLDAQGKKARIFIPSLAYETDINLHTEPKLNDELTVTVRSIRLAYLHVRFTVGGL